MCDFYVSQSVDKELPLRYVTSRKRTEIRFYVFDGNLPHNSEAIYISVSLPSLIFLLHFISTWFMQCYGRFLYDFVI
jgi:hypothetical protein